LRKQALIITYCWVF